MMESLYDFSLKTIDGTETTLANYRGQAILIVNVASHCGFTPQYEGLEKLHREFSKQGFEVLGFPCNQFGAQEPGADAEIKSFCETSYSVTFPIFSKIDVNGPNSHPLFSYLKKKQKGLLGSEAIKWNFTKFLVNRKGEVLQRYAPATNPENLRGDIEAALAD